MALATLLSLGLLQLREAEVNVPTCQSTVTAFQLPTAAQPAVVRVLPFAPRAIQLERTDAPREASGGVGIPQAVKIARFLEISQSLFK